MLPGTVDGMKHVCYFRQALALDERRVKFAPEYAYGGSAAPTDNLHEHASLNPKNDAQHHEPKEPLPSPDDPRYDPEHAARSSSSPPKITELSASDQDPEAAPAISAPFPLERPDNLPERRVSSMKIPKDDAPPHTLEVWFAGTHSDMLVLSKGLRFYATLTRFSC